MGWNSDEAGSDLVKRKSVLSYRRSGRTRLYGIYRLSKLSLKESQGIDADDRRKVESLIIKLKVKVSWALSHRIVMVWVMGLSTIRLRWVGGLGCDLNLEEGHFQSPMEGGCPDEVSMELPIASNLVTVPVMWDGSVSYMTALHDKDSDVDPGPMSTTPGPAVSLGPAGPSMRKGETIEFTTKSISYSYKGRILNYLSGIDLSFNKLTSEIPYQVGNLTGIHSLNLSHNELSGPIPLSFSYLRQIESLDLSYNYLNGKIPTQLVELYNLAVFSVAHNNLTDIFYLSFTISYVTVLLVIAAVLCINPYW
ncbi:hypothetical protein QYF36_008533 [Acer negundo]|nr:hypothetical protein QYF36_008533 [Acer negundo]